MKEAAVHFAAVKISVIQQNAAGYPARTGLETERVAKFITISLPPAQCSHHVQQLTFHLA